MLLTCNSLLCTFWEIIIFCRSLTTWRFLMMKLKEEKKYYVLSLLAREREREITAVIPTQHLITHLKEGMPGGKLVPFPIHEHVSCTEELISETSWNKQKSWSLKNDWATRRHQWLKEHVSISIWNNTRRGLTEIRTLNQTSAWGNTVSPPLVTSVRYISTVAMRCPPLAIFALSAK